MHIRESKQKMVAAAYVRVQQSGDESLPPDISVEFRPGCDCPICMEEYLRAYLLMCMQIAVAQEIDFDTVVRDAKDCLALPSYLQ